ncbi:MAG: Luciferase-like, subgroup [Acidimicrobiales bacterium]|nr:Luciferase-like, subgroup [Acidimicrobiales bacterium]
MTDELPEVFLFLPQMRLSTDAIVERAVAAEEAGVAGIAFMDHLAPPIAEHQPMYEALTLATWVAARTERLKVGTLVLCDAFRHPAVLAREAVTIQEASGGRFELGIGWGSVPAELPRFGVTTAGARERVERLGETLTLLEAFWTGEPVHHDGPNFQVAGAQQLPVPAIPIPIVIGGSGPRTLALVRRHAEWWNLPVHMLDRLDDLRDQVGSARPSVQHMVCWEADAALRPEAEATARRRFGAMGPLLVGDADRQREQLLDLGRRGVERVYLWFTDFAEPGSLRSFGRHVLGARG